MTKAIVVENIIKIFGKPGGSYWKQNPKRSGQNDHIPVIVAVDRVSFEVDEGEIFGVLGPSGSGKTTLIRLIATLLLPDEGGIEVFGFDVVKQPVEVQRLTNMVSLKASFFKKLSPMENLLYGARLNGMTRKETRVRMEEILFRLGLKNCLINKPMDEMSGGTQQIVAIAKALLSRPQLLLMDEPTAGLDPSSKREVQDVIKQLNKEFGTTILLTTHDRLEAENLCDRIAIVDRGKIVAMDNPMGLRKIISPNGQETIQEDALLELA
jgi:ABC-2 type transport system ATP-binding protein